MARALLLKRPSPFAYPGSSPGYDPNHIALAGGQLRFSGVSASGNGFINVGGGGKGVITGAPTSVRDGLIGPAMKVTAANQVCNFAGCPQIADTTQTVAAIFRIDSLAGFNGIVATSNTNGKGLYIAQNNSTGILVGVGGGSNSGTTLNGITFAAGNDYFLAVSVNAAAGTTSGVAVNLRTGQLGYGTGTTIIALAASDGTFSIGGTGGLGGGSTIAAGMASSSLLSVPELLLWAQDPWSFWYPRTLDLTMMLKAASGGAATGTLATTEAADIGAFAGTFSDQGTLATTEATDTAAFAGTFADTGTLATTEATDTAAFAGSFADQGSFAVTEATDAAAFNGNVDTSGTFATTEGSDVAAFTGGNVISGTLATTEAIDTAAFAGGFSDQGSFALTEAADVTAFAGTFDDEGILAVTDAPDIAAFAGGDSGTLAATEAPDIGTFTGDVPSGIDTHDGGSYDYHRYWKGLKDKEDEKRRKRLKVEAVVEIIEEVAEEVAVPTAKPENPVKPDYSRVVEKLKEIAVEQTEGRRRLDEERILQLIEDDERELINMVMKLALETAE